MVYPIYALTLTYNIALSTIILVMPLFLRDLGVGPMVLGLAASVPPLVQLVLRLPSGAVSDRVGERAVLLTATTAMALAAVMLVAAARAAATPLILAALLLSGMSRAIYWPAAQSYTSRAAGGEPTRALGLFSSIGHFGAIVGTPLAGVILAWRGFGAGFGLVAAAAVLGVVLAASLARRDRPSTGDPPGLGGAQPGAAALLASLREMLSSRPLLLAGLCMASSAVPLAMLSSFYPVYLADIGVPEEAIGLLSACRAVAAAVSSFAFGLVGAKLAPGTAWLLGAGLAGLGVGATPYLGSFAGLAVAMGLAGIASGTLQVLSMSIVSRASRPANRSMAMAFAGVFFSIALMVTPLLMGVMVQWAGVRIAFTALGLVWLGLAVVVAAPAGRIMRGLRAPVAKSVAAG